MGTRTGIETGKGKGKSEVGEECAGDSCRQVLGWWMRQPGRRKKMLAWRLLWLYQDKNDDVVAAAASAVDEQAKEQREEATEEK